mgnify:FL=1
MASFQTQVMGLTDLNISSSGTNPTEAQLTQFLTDGAKEVINQLPGHLLPLCAASQTFTSGSADTLTTGKILNVFRSDGDINQSCRKIPANQKGRVSDPEEMSYATITDPVFFIDNNTLDVLPSGGSCSYSAVEYPAVAYSASAITAFPNEAEHLVALYGAVKSIQNVLGSKASNANIVTALTAINTEIDECIAISDLINIQVDSAVSELLEAAGLVDTNIDTAVAAITTALGRVNTAVILGNAEFDLVNPEVDLANAQVDAEDIELANGYISTARGYADAGTKYISEAQASLSEAQGYVSEVSARTGHVGSQVGVAQGYISAAQGYANEIQSKISIASSYANEVQSRLQVDSAEYQWYEKQQAKLQADYDKGIQSLG